jgi:hypothetical protein
MGKKKRTGDIEYDDSNARVPDVAWNEASETFLACCVPELEPDGAIFEVHGFGKEIDPNRSLCVCVKNERIRGRKTGRSSVPGTCCRKCRTYERVPTVQHVRRPGRVRWKRT